MSKTQEAFTLTKYKLMTVCTDVAIMRDFPELAEQALAAILEIDRKILSSSSTRSKPKRTKTLDDTDKYKPTRGRVQRNPIPI